MSTITDAAWPAYRNARLGPFEYNGNLYVVLFATGSTVEVHESTDGGTTWAFKQSLGPGGQSGKAIDVVQVDNLLYVCASFVGIADSGFLVSYNMANNSATNIDISGNLSLFSNISGNLPLFLSVRSPTNIVVWHQAPPENGFRRIGYSIYNGSNWTTTTPTFQNSSVNHHDLHGAVMDDDGRVHVVYSSSFSSQTFIRTLNTANSLSASSQISTSDYGVPNYAAGLGDAISTDVYILTVYNSQFFSEFNIYKANPADSPTWTEHKPTSGIEADSTNPGTIVVQGGILYCFCVELSSDDLVVSNDQGTGVWTSGETFATSTTMGLSANSIGNSIGVVYNDNGTVKYEALVLYDGPWQYLRPDGDVTTTGWTDAAGTSTNLYANIDEEVASDADYIKVSP